MTDALLISLVQAVQFFITAYTWVIIITALISWVNPDPYNPIVQILYKLSAPAYKLVSKIPTRIGNIDLAPLIIVFALWFINNLLSNLIIEGLR
ncbi:YggT family protein [Campylobacter helveticus]|uniref:YggT family protein n=1 Tax=Campylobacter helveticus TaxID=28898 RepID=A0AAX2UK56_9BACT|nr:YggT family protein [Campylobacter helveticus]ARE80505.1 putative membrane protein, YGGT family [Campylobacter helveticus]MCR2040239.1 YggT family protein [Campylobacter helveticus]MCR2055350.1 YggT family protein [Campylobacter helveticus]MCR2056287.1 YggT family protein [Campylobacter helveticus]MCR2060134.1 YggT family protein [Campylobacter helveticus]